MTSVKHVSVRSALSATCLVRLSVSHGAALVQLSRATAAGAVATSAAKFWARPGATTGAAKSVGAAERVLINIVTGTMEVTSSSDKLAEAFASPAHSYQKKCACRPASLVGRRSDVSGLILTYISHPGVVQDLRPAASSLRTAVSGRVAL